MARDDAFDLVVCQGVLPYLDDAGCAKAIDNLGAMTAGFLYLEAITKKDIRDVIDNAKTDVQVHERTAAWYRARLRKHYTEVGCGLWAKRDAPVLFYELERRLRAGRVTRLSAQTSSRKSATGANDSLLRARAEEQVGVRDRLLGIADERAGASSPSR